MVLIALLLIALVCLALGLILASAYWLVGSLAASAVAAFLLWRVRGQQPASKRTAGSGAATAPARGAPAPGPGSGGPGASSGTSSEADSVWVIDGRPDYHRQDCTRLGDGEPERIPRAQAKEDGFTACTDCGPDAAPAPSAGPTADAPAEPAGSAGAPAGDPNRPVWVVDGQPDYHLQSCSRLDGTDAESVPWSQASVDGFAPCAQCRPDQAPAEAPSDDEPAATPAVIEAVPQALEPAVAGGAVLLAKTAPAAVSEPVPEPVSEPSETPASSPETQRDVWVVDGRPEYHRQDCARLQGADAVDIPWSQATEDGFVACDVCMPDAAAPEPAGEPLARDGASEPEPVSEPEPAATVEPEPEPAAAEADPTARPVWVVDGRPEYHRENCASLEGADAVDIPWSQATEDGFLACTVCTPDAAGESAPIEQPSEPIVEPAAAAAQDSAPAADLRQVWVIDGQPQYHRDGCDRIQGANAVWIPWTQATEDGFVACEVCQPDGPVAFAQPDEPPAAPTEEVGHPAVEAAPEPVAEIEPVTAAEPEPAAKPEPVTGAEPPAASTGERQVWVIDGRPSYHRDSCPQLAGTASEQIPWNQASEDGFVPCEQCDPDGVGDRSVVETEPAAAAEPEPEVVAEPEPEPDPIPEPAAEVVSEPEPIPEPAAEVVPEPVAEVASEPEPEPVVEVEPEPELVSLLEPVAEPEPEPEPPPVIDVVPVAKPEPVAEVVPEPVPEPEPVAEVVPEPEPVPEPAPVAEVVPEPETEPVAAEASSHPASDSADQVWVIDGRPRYHLADCLIIKEQSPMPIPRSQALEDGFLPCALCEPNLAPVA